MVECNGTRFRAHSHTAPSVTTLLWIEDDGRLTLFRIRNEEIHLAYIYTGVASVTNVWVKYDRTAGLPCHGGMNNNLIERSRFLCGKLNVFRSMEDTSRGHS